MKIAICTKHDVFGAIVLNHLIPSLSAHELRVFFSQKTRPGESAVPELARLKLLERDLPLHQLFPLVDRTQEAGRLFTPHQLARRFQFETHVLNDLQPTGDGAALYAFEPDVIISVRFSLIFKQPLLDLPPLGVYNLHPGLLPAFGGLFAPLRQMLSGASRLGCTFHQVDSGIDTGPIVDISWVPLRQDHCLMQHTAELYLSGIPLIVKLIHQLNQHQQPVLAPQVVEQRGYYSYPDAEVFRAFKQKGLKLMDRQAYRELLSLFTPSRLTPELDDMVDSAFLTS